MATTSQAAAFTTGRCGTNSMAFSSTGLDVGQQVLLNGKSDLSSCVQANDLARVYKIELVKADDPIYAYAIRVDAEGPHGFSSGSMYLAFKDRGGDVYHLFIFDSKRKWHTVKYNSESPPIVQFKWSNTDIPDW